MDMDKVVKQALEGGLTPELVLDILIVILGIMIVLWIRGWVVRYLAHLKFKSSMDISKDVIVRETTPTGYVDYRLESLDRTSIILRSVDHKLKKIIPTKTANDRDWVIVHRQDEGQLSREMADQDKPDIIMDIDQES